MLVSNLTHYLQKAALIQLPSITKLVALQPPFVNNFILEISVFYSMLQNLWILVSLISDTNFLVDSRSGILTED